MSASGWIPEEHLRYFATTLAMYAEADFDDDDWVGLKHALFPDEGSEQVRSITWPFGDTEVAFSYEPGGGVVVIFMQATADLEARADTLIFVLQDVVNLSGRT